MQPQKLIQGETGAPFKQFKHRSQVDWNVSQSRMATAVMMLIYKEQFAKYFHYDTLKSYYIRGYLGRYGSLPS